MGNRADEIRRQMAKKRKMKSYPVKKRDNSKNPIVTDWEDSDAYPIFEAEPPNKIHPLWNKELFLFKILASAVLVLIVAILFKTSTPKLDNARSFVKDTMETEFQFAAVSNWYEKQFGKPLALFPVKNGDKVDSSVAKEEYVMPASGKVLTNFAKDGRGVMIETKNNESVDAMDGGKVIFAGKKNDLGNTVIIQHSDKTESWYGNLETIDVHQYEYVDTGKKVGTVSNKDDGLSGEFYFAIKQGKKFIDPIQVIKFE
ncbi:peptidoglycan DD-metalloendopeptidase family protein [Heyndrickxia sp. NPDC080065]|uniref:peptidoglycan DD-metalloendopeptidase family protein n=1 Tax=Heyndrickxia sp. NPDC080065 TaxID=3390568 RepID=UPI003D08E95D